MVLVYNQGTVMLKVQRIKKTNQIVHVLGKESANHSLVLFPSVHKNRKGNWGSVQVVRNDNLVDDNPQ